MSIIIIVSVAAALLNDTIRTEGPLVAVDTGFEDEIRGELDEGKYVTLTMYTNTCIRYMCTLCINQKETARDKFKQAHIHSCTNYLVYM